jgi:hypothetical protein
MHSKLFSNDNQLQQQQQQQQQLQQQHFSSGLADLSKSLATGWIFHLISIFYKQKHSVLKLNMTLEV